MVKSVEEHAKQINLCAVAFNVYW